MEEAQSTIKVLREPNSVFIQQIAELRKKFAEVSIKNIKLKQDKDNIENVKEEIESIKKDIKIVKSVLADHIHFS